MSKLLVPLFALAVGLFSFNPSFAADEKPRDLNDPQAAAYDGCAKVCADCQRACDSCATHCAKLIAQGKKEHVHTLQTCQDCSTLCAAAASITARMGPYSDIVCKACAEACSRCNKMCEKHSDDPMMKKCGDECKRCEKACQDMLKYVAGLK